MAGCGEETSVEVGQSEVVGLDALPCPRYDHHERSRLTHVYVDKVGYVYINGKEPEARASTFKFEHRSRANKNTDVGGLFFGRLDKEGYTIERLAPGIVFGVQSASDWFQQLPRYLTKE